MGTQTIGWVSWLLRGPQGSAAGASAPAAELTREEKGASEAASDRPPRRIFAAGMVWRVAFRTASGAYVFRPDYFGFGWEAGRIASSLAAGRGFCDPFQGATGPTAWVAPLYPVVLAGIFRAFGTYSPLSGWVALTFN